MLILSDLVWSSAQEPNTTLYADPVWSFLLQGLISRHHPLCWSYLILSDLVHNSPTPRCILILPDLVLSSIQQPNTTLYVDPVWSCLNQCTTARHHALCWSCMIFSDPVLNKPTPHSMLILSDTVLTLLSYLFDLHLTTFYQIKGDTNKRELLKCVCWDAAIFCCTCTEQFSTTSRSLVSTGWCDIAHCKTINAAVREFFVNNVISRFGDIPWPPRSPDLSVCDFFLWGYLKNRVYTTRPRALDELKQRIQEEIRGTPAEMLQRAMGKLNGKLKECIRRGGRHLQDVVFRHW